MLKQLWNGATQIDKTNLKTRVNLVASGLLIVNLSLFVFNVNSLLLVTTHNQEEQLVYAEVRRVEQKLASCNDKHKLFYNQLSNVEERLVQCQRSYQGGKGAGQSHIGDKKVGEETNGFDESSYNPNLDKINEAPLIPIVEGGKGELIEESSQEEKEVEWTQQKEDRNIFYSIFDGIENLNFSHVVHGPEQTKILVHVNSRNILSEVASDVRMMHRQLIRMINIMHQEYKFEIKFWVQTAWAKEEQMFRDCQYTRKFPGIGLNKVYGSTDYDVHIFIQNHLNFIDPKTIDKTLDSIIRSPTGTVACMYGPLARMCQHDLIAFTAKTGKNIYKYFVNRPNMTDKITEEYNTPRMILSSALSQFIYSLKDTPGNFKLVRLESSFYSPKIGKTYQTFTAHPTSRLFPKYMTMELSDEDMYNFTFLAKTVPCDGNGWVTFIKTSRSSNFRRSQIRRMYHRLQPSKYQKTYNVYFLIGLPRSSEGVKIKEQIKNETESYGDIILYDVIDQYDALPDKTFAGYQFFHQRCKNKEYVVFHDDDVFIKVNELKAHFKQIKPESPEVRCLKGKCIPETSPNYLGKYFLWVGSYPHDYFIPRYSNGQCTAMTASAAKKIYNVSSRTSRRDFRIEDMLYSGVFREKAKVHNIKGMATAVCQHFQFMKQHSNDLEKLTTIYQSGRLKINPQT